MDKMMLHTIGFTQKSAEQFFGLLKSAGVRRLVDVRLNVTSQLAGFAKQKDLRYFLKVISGINYLHLKEAAPTKTLLDGFKKGDLSWEAYENGYASLLKERHAEGWLPSTLRSGDCFLCSEHEPTRCHRRLLAEYCSGIMENVEIGHLLSTNSP
jgi:uncharacterized protein (DUF488 family)